MVSNHWQSYFTLKGESAICIIHHTRKVQAPNNVLSEINGSTGIQAAMGGILVLKKKGTHGRLHITGRDVEELELALEFNCGTCDDSRPPCRSGDIEGSRDGESEGNR